MNVWWILADRASASTKWGHIPARVTKVFDLITRPAKISMNVKRMFRVSMAFAKTRSDPSLALASPVITWKTILALVKQFDLDFEIISELCPTFVADVDECTNSPCIDGTCINQPGSYLCLCEPGFTLERNVCIGIKITLELVIFLKLNHSRVWHI